MGSSILFKLVTFVFGLSVVFPIVAAGPLPHSTYLAVTSEMTGYALPTMLPGLFHSAGAPSIGKPHSHNSTKPATSTLVIVTVTAVPGIFATGSTSSEFNLNDVPATAVPGILATHSFGTHAPKPTGTSTNSTGDVPSGFHGKNCSPQIFERCTSKYVGMKCAADGKQSFEHFDPECVLCPCHPHTNSTAGVPSLVLASPPLAQRTPGPLANPDVPTVSVPFPPDGAKWRPGLDLGDGPISAAGRSSKSSFSMTLIIVLAVLFFIGYSSASPLPQAQSEAELGSAASMPYGVSGLLANSSVMARFDPSVPVCQSGYQKMCTSSWPYDLSCNAETGLKHWGKEYNFECNSNCVCPTSPPGKEYFANIPSLDFPGFADPGATSATTTTTSPPDQAAQLTARNTTDGEPYGPIGCGFQQLVPLCTSAPFHMGCEGIFRTFDQWAEICSVLCYCGLSKRDEHRPLPHPGGPPDLTGAAQHSGASNSLTSSLRLKPAAVLLLLCLLVAEVTANPIATSSAEVSNAGGLEDRQFDQWSLSCHNKPVKEICSVAPYSYYCANGVLFNTLDSVICGESCICVQGSKRDEEHGALSAGVQEKHVAINATSIDTREAECNDLYGVYCTNDPEEERAFACMGGHVGMSCSNCGVKTYKAYDLICDLDCSCEEITWI